MLVRTIELKKVCYVKACAYKRYNEKPVYGKGGQGSKKLVQVINLADKKL